MLVRTAIFIDGAYLAKILRDEFNQARIDFQALSKAMAGETEILRTYYYNCLPYQGNPPDPQDKRRYDAARRFHDALKMIPRYEVRLGRLESRGRDHDGKPIFEQKRVDILLGVDMVQLATKGHIQQAVIVAGDSDFIPAISVAKSEGVIMRLFHGKVCHDDLRREVDERRQFDQDFVDSITRTTS